MTGENNKHNPWRIVIIIFCTLAFLVGISFLPFERWAGGKISNFNLVGDIMQTSESNSDSVNLANDDFTVDEGAEVMDSELQTAMLESHDGNKQRTMAADSNTNDLPVVAVQPSKEGTRMVLEDYTLSGQGLKKMRESLARGGVTRIAVIGDSYIEGDIFTQDLRQLFQAEYGGSGVGYMNMHSDFPGFRRSVKQGGKGWKEYAANKKADSRYTGLSQHYFISSENATSSYKGTKALPRLDEWSNSQFLFISPENAEIKVKVGDGDWQTHNIVGSPEVQCISVPNKTSSFEVSTATPGVIGLGTWLYGNKGVTLDCMSSRGFSGLTLTKVSPDLSRQMSKYIDYDLIILEFGINAMSPKQKDFSVYSNRMVGVINHVRKCYPNADIIMMGIGDRGEKRGGEVHSMTSTPYMVNAQRDAARKAHCLFYDTRESMGGDDAIVGWVKQGLANKDYIHLTHKGGKKLAEPLFDAIKANMVK